MERKYNMTKEDNIFFAKRKLVDNLYKSANLEGIIVTIEDIFYFVNNVNTGKISIDDMLKLKGLKDAWEYILSTIDEELTIDYIKKIHFEICKGQNIEPLGEFRDRGVGITGTSYRPKLPSECNYDEELNDIMKIENSLDRSILAVPVEKIGEYFTILIDFYETNDYTNIKKWIYDNCIDGVE